jgi:F-box protein 11
MKKYLWLFGIFMALLAGPVLAGRATGLDGENDLVVSPKGRVGRYSTISKALEAAAPGAVIRVRPGTYREGLTLTKPVTIIGEGKPGKIRIESPDAACITSTAHQAYVKNLALHCQAEDDYGVDISGGDLTLEDCSISADVLACVGIHGAGTDPVLKNCRIHPVNKSGGSGIFVYDQGQGTITSCKIYGNKLSGVEIREYANPKVSGCEIYDNQSGVFVNEQGQGIISDCKIYENKFSGIEIIEYANPKVSGCEIYSSKEGGGVFVNEQGQGTITDCKIYQNKLSGVEIGKYANPKVSGCEIYSGKEGSGVFVYEHGQGKISDCKIYENKFSGIEIREYGNPEIRGCEIYGSTEGSGIFVNLQGQGIISDCKIYKNKLTGIEICDGSELTIKNCQINQNGYEAIYVHTDGSATVTNCDLTANSEGAWDIEDGCEVRSSENIE